MAGQFIVAFTAAGVAIGVSTYAWRHRTVSGASIFAALMLIVALYSMGAAIGMLSRTQANATLWNNVRFTAIVFISVLWFTFAAQYTVQERWLRYLTWLTVVPAITLVLIWTNPWHHLLFKQVVYTQSSPFLIATDWTFGPWFFVHVVYSYFLIILGSYFIFQAVIQTPQLYRKQAAALLFGAAMPGLGILFTSFHLIPGSQINYGPVAFALSGVALAWGHYSYRLFDLKPTAHRILISSMSDAILVLDMQNRVVDFNPASKTIFNFHDGAAIGQSIEQLFSFGQHLVRQFQNGTVTQMEIDYEQVGKQHHYDLRISPLKNPRGQLSGRLIVMRDITWRKQAEKEKELLITELQNALTQVNTLSGLLPICANCKKIRTDEGYWQEVELYVESHSEAKFSHSICPGCAKDLYPQFFEDEQHNHPANETTL